MCRSAKQNRLLLLNWFFTGTNKALIDRQPRSVGACEGNNLLK